MNSLVALLSALRLVHISPMACLVAASIASLLFGLIGVWSLWRVRQILAIVPILDTRLATLSTSVSLLTDTTEACFKAVAIQLHALQHPSVPKSRGRQRRVAGALKRGESFGEIAAREEVSESEIELRAGLSGSQGSSSSSRPKIYGSLLS